MSQPYFRELDGFRALAILPVLGLHGSYGRLQGGFLGVDLFFVISGFLITSLLMAEKCQTGNLSLRNFYARRALRILPPLVAAILLAVAITPTPLNAALPALLFYANFVSSSTLGALFPTWSLSVEEHFYLLWPLLFLHLANSRVHLLLCTIVAAMILRTILLMMDTDSEALYRWTFTRIDSPAIGSLAALMLPRWHRYLARPWLGALSVAVVCVCLVGLPRLTFPMQSAGFTLFALLCAVAITSSISGSEDSRTRRFLSWLPLRIIGRRSYGLYLYHFPIFLALEFLRVPGDLLNFVWVLGLKLFLSLCVAELSYRTIESYAASYKERFRSSAETRTVGASQQT